MEVIYEDNHIIAVNKTCREIVQGDKTGDTPLSDMLKAWLKEKYCKPGNVFVGVTHRWTARSAVSCYLPKRARRSPV